MKAVVCHAYGPPRDLVYEEVDPPTPGARQVRIAVHGAGVNFADVLMVQGLYQFKPPVPFSPGFEVAGDVIEVGPEVGSVRAGDRVAAFVPYGGYAEEVVAEEGSVVPLPGGVTYDQGAVFLVAYGTSHHALTDRAGIRSGETLLVTGASGGVGLAAVELGKLHGAVVIAAVGSREKAEVVHQYGADHVVDYSTEGIRDRVLELTGGTGADVIFDPVGGDVFDESIRAIAWEGRYLVIGFASGRIPKVAVNRLLLKQSSVVGVYWGDWAERNPEESKRRFAELLAWCAAGRLTPHTSLTLPVHDAARAMEALESRRVTGKTLLRVR